MVLQVCVDDSSEDGHSLVLAGYIATVDDWQKFSNEWAELLTIRPPWPRFKMAEIMGTGPGEEAGERVVWHYRLVEKYACAAICVAVPRPPLVRAVRDYLLPPGYANPYYLAWRALIRTCLDWQNEAGAKETVDFVFDSQSEAPKLLTAWEGYRKNLPSEAQALAPNIPVFRRDDDFLPLQAADMLAWWMRRRYARRGTILGHDFPFPWPQSMDGPPMLQAEYTERGIRTQLKSDKYGHINDRAFLYRLSTEWIERPVAWVRYNKIISHTL